MRALLLFLLLQWQPDGVDELSYALHEFKHETVVVLTYPTGGTNIKACVEWREQGTNETVEERCEVPSSPIGDVFVWADFGTRGLFVVARVDQRQANGSIRTFWAFPIWGDS